MGALLLRAKRDLSPTPRGEEVIGFSAGSTSSLSRGENTNTNLRVFAGNLKT